MSNPGQSVIGNVTGIERTPNSELVQVHYNRIVPETREGSLDSEGDSRSAAEGRVGSEADGIRAQSVGMLASECKAGHECKASDDGKGVRDALLVSLRYDKDPGVRLKALEGLQPLCEPGPAGARCRCSRRCCAIRMRRCARLAIDLLVPVQQDSSVRQVLRQVSTQDENPYIRTVSYNALQGSDSIQ